MAKTFAVVFLSAALTTLSPAAVIIDDFSTTTSSTAYCATPVGGSTSTGSLAGTNTFSGQRTLTSSVTALLGAGGGCNEVRVNTPNGNSVLTVNNDFGVFGRSTVQWSPIGAVDFSTETHLLLDIGIDGGIAPNDTTTFTFRFCATAACTDAYTRSWSITGQVAPAQTYSFDFAGFTIAGTPSWASIAYADLVIDSGNSSDMRIDNIYADTPVPEPATLLLTACALIGAGLLRRR
ncbi:MAG: PEP-CTERM sorting domain-containing protein [Acidobacteria bacterium]|nr:PEP-CTERM sorting domain-containing protein [Acidobacteriota bacterium]